MNDLDTSFEADEAGIRALGSWMRGSVTDALAVSTSALTFAREDRGAWSGPSADAFRSRMTSVLSSSDDGVTATGQAASGLERFADAIAGLRARVGQVRERAAGSGLALTPTSIVRPAEPASLPPTPDDTATPAEARAYADARTARDVAVSKQTAFSEASADMSAVRADLQSAVVDLDRAVADVRGLLIPAIDFITGAGLGILFDKGAVAMRGQATGMLQDAAKLRAATVRPGAALAPRLFYDDLDRAGQLVAGSKSVTDDAARLVRAGKAAGWIVGGVLAGVSIYQDMEAGESTAQAVVSNGGGFVASVGAGAAVGAALGTIVPGPGNVIGAVAGAVVGGAVGIVTSGAIDSFFENGWDVGTALSNGVSDLADTGAALWDLGDQGRVAAGEAISRAGDGLSDAWDSIFG